MTFDFRGGRTLSAEGKVARTTAKVRHLETFGAPIVKVSFATPTGYRHLVAVLSAVTPSGSEIVISDGGTDTQASGKQRAHGHDQAAERGDVDSRRFPPARHAGSA